MAKRKASRIVKTKKKKLHPLIVFILGFFAIMLLVVATTTFLYRSASLTQQVAGTATSSAIIRPSLTPTPSACVIMGAAIGQMPCGKDAYKVVSAVCGDGTKVNLTSSECRSLSGWFGQLAQSCTGRSSCNRLVTAHPSITPGGTR